jgi:hypothetical protein
MELIPSSGQHLHIVLNHFPVIGTLFALGMLLAALYLNSEDLKRSSLVVFVLLSLLAIPTYVSGGAARWALEGNAGVSAELIAAHQDAALLAFACLGITGVLAWLALWQYRRFARVPNWNLMTVLALGILTFATMARAGNLGGYINRPELRTAEEAVAVEEEGSRAAIELFIDGKFWAWPAMEAAHFMGMALLFGVVLLVALRVLGLARVVPFAALHRLLPLGVLGLLINIVTGMYFFIGDSGRYVAMDGFPPKIALLVLGGVALLCFTSFNETWALRAGNDASLTAKAMAAATIALWAGVIIFGRLLPYYGGGG